MLRYVIAVHRSKYTRDVGETKIEILQVSKDAIIAAGAVIAAISTLPGL